MASGASIMEAKEIARHADIRQTAKYTHIGMRARAEALGNLPAPDLYAYVELSGIYRDSGGVLGHEVSPGVSEGAPEQVPEDEKTPSQEGVSSPRVTDFREVSVDVSSGGGGNCTRVPDSATLCAKCGYEMRPGGWPEHGREDEALRELVAAWHGLAPKVREKIVEPVRDR